MDFPKELLAEILSHLRTNATSFRDLQVAFTCKALYSELMPLIREKQTSLVMGALDQGALALWGPTESREDGKDAFRQSLQREDQDVQEPFFSVDTRRTIELTVKCSDDVDLVWSLHRYFLQYRKLEAPILDHLILKLKSTDVQPSLRPGATFEQAMAAMREDAKATLVYWGTAGDQERLSRALRAFSLLAEALVENGMEVEDQLRAQLDEPALTLADVEALDGVAAIPDAPRVPKLVLTRVPSPRIFPLQNVDAVMRGSSTSLKELHLVGCLPSGMSDNLWDALLRLWTFTQLTQLTLKHMDIPLAPLISFLQRNPSIRSATFVLVGAPSISGERLQCSYIRELSAVPEILLPLLRDASVTFPSLETLRIGQDWVREDVYPNFRYCTLDDVTTILSCIPKTAPSVHTLQLNLAYTGELLAWLNSTAPLPSPLGALDGEMLNAVAAATPANTAKPSLLAEALRSLHQITSLDFTVSDDPRSSSIRRFVWPPFIYIKPGPVVDFVAAFPTLKTVRLLKLFYRPHERGEPPRESYDDFWPEVSKVWAKAGSALEKVEIDGIGADSRQTQKVAVWVKGEAEPRGGFGAFPVTGVRI